MSTNDSKTNGERDDEFREMVAPLQIPRKVVLGVILIEKDYAYLLKAYTANPTDENRKFLQEARDEWARLLEDAKAECCEAAWIKLNKEFAVPYPCVLN